MYLGILFCLSTLERLLQPSSMYAGISFGLSTAMFYALVFYSAIWSR